jgi:hypothetical protein
MGAFAGLTNVVAMSCGQSGVRGQNWLWGEAATLFPPDASCGHTDAMQHKHCVCMCVQTQRLCPHDGAVHACSHMAVRNNIDRQY